MEGKEFDFKGGSANGFLMLLLCLIAFAVTISLFVKGVSGDGDGFMVGLAVVLFFISLFISKGYTMQEPNEARALMFFGKYVGTFRKTGFYWINPLMSAKKVSLRARNLNPEPIKVNDKAGNPVLIGMVLVWRLKDTYKALFDIDSETTVAQLGGMAGARMNMFEKFVAVQSDAALRQVAGMYAYDENGAETGEVTLRGGGDIVNDLLTEKLNERLSMAGLEVVEARINYLAYAPEIAAVMLRRQQAAAIISAREKIVEGAVSMVKLALDKLNEDNIVELDEEKKAAMVSNLLVVLCSEENAQPVINSGTLNH
ncbi:MAG: SPFH domain-containing protein [Bacteroidaceae bacterium]|nr:SPFH domain-containing protein [Bacteroidaceae bacterium]